MSIEYRGLLTAGYPLQLDFNKTQSFLLRSYCFALQRLKYFKLPEFDSPSHFHSLKGMKNGRHDLMFLRSFPLRQVSL